MPRMAGSDGPKRKVSLTLSQEAFDMIEQVAAARGGNYYSRIVEEAIRVYHARLMKDGTLSRSIQVRASRIADHNVSVDRHPRRKAAK